MKHEKVSTARGRKLASTRWLQRQFNDPYVAKARDSGYRSRAAFKLLELQEQFRLLHAGMCVVDLGAAPGGWTQVAVALTQAEQERGAVVALDLLPMDPISGASILMQDFMTDDAPTQIMNELKGRSADIVLSDMAPSFTGHRQTDHLRNMALVEAALELAEHVLAPGGCFVAKIIQGSEDNTLAQRLRQRFRQLDYAKPPASRDDSSERFVIARDFQEQSNRP